MAIDDPAIQLFGSLATVGFGFLGFAGAAEIVKAAEANGEERAIFNSIVALCCVLSASSLLPLIISGLENWLMISSVFLLSTSVVVFSYVLGGIFRGKTLIRYKTVSCLSILASAVVICFLMIKTFTVPSVTAYKLCLGWLALMISVRFSLFAKYLLSRK